MAPTKKWAEDGVFLPATDPPDGYIERGFDPTQPFLAKYLNWILNFIQSVVIGAEHDPLTGAHTDITATSVTTDTLDVDNGPIDFDVAYGQWTVDEDYKYETAPTRVAKIGLSRWQFQVDPYVSSVFAAPRFADIGKSMGYTGELWIDIDDIVASTRDSQGGDTVLSACKLFLQKGNSTITATLDWVLEELDTSTSADTYTAIASGTINDAGVTAVVTDTTYSEVTLWNTNKSLVNGRFYRLRLAVSASDLYGFALFGGTLSYKPNRIIAT